MEIFRAPRVTLIARPEFLEPEHLRVQWRGDSSPGERLAEFAGRICYMSQHNRRTASTAEYLENIKKQGHGSVLEHAVYVLLIEGIFALLLARAGASPGGLRLLTAVRSATSTNRTRRSSCRPRSIGDEQLEAEWHERGRGRAGGVRARGRRSHGALHWGHRQGGKKWGAPAGGEKEWRR